MKMMTRMMAMLAGAAYVAMATAPAAGAAELRMSWWGGESRHVATQKAIAACGEKYGHTIKGEFIWTVISKSSPPRWRARRS